MKRFMAMCLGLAMVFMLAGASLAGDITLNFTSLPSAQGWTYFLVGNSVSETSVFSVDGSVLYQNSMGVGYAGQGANGYAMTGVIDPHKPFTVWIRARVIDEEGDIATNSFGFCFGAHTETGGGFIIGIGKKMIQACSATVCGLIIDSTINNTVFHDYRLEYIPKVSNKLFVDNVLISEDVPLLYSIGMNRIYIGDGTGGTNARAEITYFKFSQRCDDIAVKPYTFTAGTPAKATEVNANFDTLYQQNNALNCQVQDLKAAFCKEHPTSDVCK